MPVFLAPNFGGFAKSVGGGCRQGSRLRLTDGVGGSRGFDWNTETLLMTNGQDRRIFSMRD